MKRFLTAILTVCVFTGCAGFPFKSEHYFGYSCEGEFARFSSYCREKNPQIKINPDVVALMEKSWALVKLKNWSEIIRMTSAAISIDPSSSDAYALRSWAYLEKGFRENAFADAEEAIRLDPKNTFALNNRGSWYSSGGNFMSAKEDFKKACQAGLPIGCSNLKLIVDSCLKNAEEAFQKKDWDGVIKSTSDIADNETALAVRCAAYANQKQFDAAIADCDAAIKMNPDLALAYNNKGYALELMGKKKEAALNYEFSCNLKLSTGCENLKKISLPHPVNEK